MADNRRVKEPESVWWNYVSGPSLLVREAADALCGGKNLCLCVPEFLPWRDAFFEHVRSAVLEVETSLVFETLYDATKTPGKYLVDHFGLSASYRPTKSYADFLRERNAFAERVLCVPAAEEEVMRPWFEFGKEYKPSSVHGGLVLLETRAVPAVGIPAHMRVLVYDDFVSEYDMLVFAGLLLPDNKMSTEQKKYLTTMTVSLLGKDAENAAEFVDSFQYDRDAAEQFAAAGIPLAENMERRVWNAQVQTLFPLIMREAREFIDRWRGKIEDAFEYANKTYPAGLLDTNRTPVESADALELATLRHLMCNRRYDDAGSETGDYILYIPDDNARARLELLYNMRNRIAHGKVCTAEEVAKLLG